MDEFRRASQGRSFHIIKFSRLLELFGASNTVVQEIQVQEEAANPDVPLSSRGAISSRSVEAERAVASWLVQSGYKISAASLREGYDYLVHGNGNVFAVDVMYVQNPMVVHRLRDRSFRYRRSPQVPVTLVAACQTPELAEKVERIWTKLDPPFRLCTGVLTADTTFEPIRPL